MENKRKAQLFWLVILRLAIGWHFLYEGLVKLSNPNWTSFGYLMDSKGLFEGMFHSMAENESVLNIVDFLNIWGLIAIGLSLIIGFLSRPAIIGGITLLAFYYLSHPAFISLKYALPSTGSYFIIDKTIIELFALVVLFVFPTSKEIGIDKLVFTIKPSTRENE
ncbi:MAG: DoxX subfamily [Bacteroidetes bacterium]|nr:MAG: DoxX subfamily [Bacteroidota bacterium]